MMRWPIIGFATVILVITGVLLTVGKKSNCGGNSAALAACKGYITVLQVWSADHRGERFQLEQTDSETRRYLGDLPGASWIRPARLLARVNDVHVDSGSEKRIIMVCDRAYDNVPQRIIGNSPMRHAVAYSTGDIGLISPEEFGRLELSGFVDLRTLETGKVEQGARPNDEERDGH